MKELNSKGFTLVELMIVVAIASIILGGMFVTVMANDVQMQSTDVKMTIQDAAREGLYRMTQEIRQSAPEQIAISGDSTQIQFNVPNNTIADMTTSDYSVDWASGTTVQYEIADSGEYICNSDKCIIRCETAYTAATAFDRCAQGDTTFRVITNDVQELTFTGNNADPTLVTISMSVQRDILNGRSVPATPLQITGQAEIRNS